MAFSNADALREDIEGLAETSTRLLSCWDQATEDQVRAEVETLYLLAHAATCAAKSPPEPPVPTVTNVAAALRTAGHMRSDWHRPGVSAALAASGFRVWQSSSRDDPAAELVAVARYDRGQWDGVTDDEREASWTAHVKSAREWCARYAVAIREAGFAVQVKLSTDDPLVLVTAASPAKPEGA